MSGIFLSLSRTENELFHRNLLHAQWIRRTPSERLSTPSSNMSGTFLSLSLIENELFYWNLFVCNGSDGLHRTTFHPLIQHGWIFFKSLTNREWTFPLESFRVQWIRWTPSERLFNPSSNMSGIFLRLSRTENGLFHRNLFVSHGSNTLGRTLHH